MGSSRVIGASRLLELLGPADVGIDEVIRHGRRLRIGERGRLGESASDVQMDVCFSQSGGWVDCRSIREKIRHRRQSFRLVLGDLFNGHGNDL